MCPACRRSAAFPARDALREFNPPCAPNDNSSSRFRMTVRNYSGNSSAKAGIEQLTGEEGFERHQSFHPLFA
jgi:hypothetical protein